MMDYYIDTILKEGYEKSNTVFYYNLLTYIDKVNNLDELDNLLDTIYEIKKIARIDFNNLPTLSIDFEKFDSIFKKEELLFAYYKLYSNVIIDLDTYNNRALELITSEGLKDISELISEVMDYSTFDIISKLKDDVFTLYYKALIEYSDIKDLDFIYRNLGNESILIKVFRELKYSDKKIITFFENSTQVNIFNANFKRLSSNLFELDNLDIIYKELMLSPSNLDLNISKVYEASIYAEYLGFFNRVETYNLSQALKIQSKILFYSNLGDNRDCIDYIVTLDSQELDSIAKRYLQDREFFKYKELIVFDILLLTKGYIEIDKESKEFIQNYMDIEIDKSIDNYKLIETYKKANNLHSLFINSNNISKLINSDILTLASKKIISYVLPKAKELETCKKELKSIDIKDQV
jgi:hypothetical protein